jgi:hypothetical protein
MSIVIVGAGPNLGAAIDDARAAPADDLLRREGWGQAGRAAARALTRRAFHATPTVARGVRGEQTPVSRSSRFSSRATPSSPRR